MPDDLDLDLAEQDRVRRGLLAYKMAHGIGTPRLSRRIKEAHPREAIVPIRTLSRFLAGDKINPGSLAICAQFLAQLPDKPTLLQGLADTLKAFYALTAPPIAPGTFTVRQGQEFLSELTLIPSQNCHIVKETLRPYAVYDGLLICSGTVMAILRDRLTMTPRLHVLKGFEAVIHHTHPIRLETSIHDAHWAPL